MKRGDIITAGISRVNSEGEGIALRDGGGGKNFVIFVRVALPGETVKCRVERVSRNYASAAALEITDSSPDRTSPACQSYGTCGGCQLQHVSYEAQVAIKRKILSDAMRGIGKIDPGEIECVPSDFQWGYRGKTTMPVGRFAGYYEQRSHRIVPFERCPVLESSLERVISEMIAAHASSGFTGYDERSGSGDIRALAARSGDGKTRNVLAGVVARRDFSRREFGALRNIHQKLLSGNPALSGSVLNVKTSADNFVWGTVFKPLCGAKSVVASLGGDRFQLDISSFFQVNRHQAERIFSRAAGEVSRSGASEVLELYSGAGGLTAYLARAAERVDAVEEWRPASRLLLNNMELNGIGNVKVFAEPAESFASDGERMKPGRYGAVVLDPPRTGAHESVIAGIIDASPGIVIYVSCNPATLARDVSRLAGAYRVESLTAYDMFPQTSHVESLCVLRHT